MAPYNGVLNVWISPLHNLSAATPVTNDSFRGIQGYIWANNDRNILYTQDKDGDENWTVYAVDLITKERRNLTPLEGINAQILSTSIKIPREVLIGLNDRDQRYHDIYRFNLTTGEKSWFKRMKASLISLPTINSRYDLRAKQPLKAARRSSSALITVVGSYS